MLMQVKVVFDIPINLTLHSNIKKIQTFPLARTVNRRIASTPICTFRSHKTLECARFISCGLANIPYALA